MSIEFVMLALAVAAAPPALLYVAIYAFRPWRSTRVGQALMLQTAGMAMLIIMALVTSALGDSPGRDIIRAVAGATWVFGMWYLLFTLLMSPGARNYWPFKWRRRSNGNGRRTE